MFVFFDTFMKAAPFKKTINIGSPEKVKYLDITVV